MEQNLQEAVADWIENSTDGPDAGRHGFVTDGNHSFFRDGTLLTTCSFSSVMKAWVPVLYTWVARLDTEHHRPHFRFLNSQIVKAAGAKFENKFLLNVGIGYLLAIAIDF